ncbi:hypothetical protein AVEN_218229-1 [Araneus ventricosus]|uniref:Uncharacterized protein n=1 Tax=Araneus ventricosus TaxID=182803 RepID=A0A4Y2QYU2_ARAVE|nr:hypothetical protein AVEN_218229-1 [Araneus ventricosus]
MKETGLQVKSFIEASTNVIQSFTNGLSLSSMRNTYIAGSSTLLSEKWNIQGSYRAEQPKSTSLLSLPKISVPRLRWPVRSQVHRHPWVQCPQIMPPIGLKRDVAKLCAITAKLSDLEPRSTTVIV